MLRTLCQSTRSFKEKHLLSSAADPFLLPSERSAVFTLYRGLASLYRSPEPNLDPEQEHFEARLKKKERWVIHVAGDRGFSFRCTWKSALRNVQTFWRSTFAAWGASQLFSSVLRVCVHRRATVCPGERDPSAGVININLTACLIASEICTSVRFGSHLLCEPHCRHTSEYIGL